MLAFMTKAGFIALSCLLVPFWAPHVAFAAPDQSKPISTVPLGAYISDAPNPRLDFFEILNRNEFVTATPKLWVTASIDFWGVQSGKIKDRIVPPEPVASHSLRISPYSRRLIAIQAILGNKKHQVYDPHKVFVWSVQTKKLLQTIDLGKRVHIVEVAFWPGKPAQAIILWRPIASHLKHMLHVDLNTGKFGKLVRYPAAKYLFHSLTGYVVFSPNGKLLASVDVMGEGFEGAIDIVELKTGKVLSRYVPRDEQPPVDGGSFFLSDTRFFFGSWPLVDPFAPVNPLAPVHAGYSYKLTAKKIKLRHESRLRCLAGVPSRPGYGFFLSEGGLELWNIPRQRRIRQWPRLRDVEQVALSRDRTVVGFYYRQEKAKSKSMPGQPFNVAVQFWNFNPANLP